MSMFFRSLFASVILSASSLANAALIESDYLAANDNLAVTDTITNLRWLDLSVSIDWTFANWSGLVQQSNGWRLATNSEVVELFSHAFPTYADVHGNAAWVDTEDAALIQNFNGFQTLFGTTTWNGGNVDSYGLYKNDANLTRMMGVSRWASSNRIFSPNFNNSVPEIPNGLYIVSNAVAVSEPSIIAIFALGILGFVTRKKMKS